MFMEILAPYFPACFTLIVCTAGIFKVKINTLNYFNRMWWRKKPQDHLNAQWDKTPADLCVVFFSSLLLEWQAVRPERLWLFIRPAETTWPTSLPKMAVRYFMTYNCLPWGEPQWAGWWRGRRKVQIKVHYKYNFYWDLIMFWLFLYMFSIFLLFLKKTPHIVTWKAISSCLHGVIWSLNEQ